jgi:hypothetical protein
LLNIEHSAAGLLASDFDFTRFEALLEWRFNTLLRRRLLPNTLDFRLLGSTFRGTLPPQRFSVIDGVSLPFTPFGGLRTLEDQPYQGEQQVALLWEHNFRTLPLELMGLRKLAQSGLSLIVHGGHGRSWIGVARLAQLNQLNAGEQGVNFYRVPERFHHELGFSVSGLFSLARIDVTKRLDASGFTVGLSVARIF